MLHHVRSITITKTVRACGLKGARAIESNCGQWIGQDITSESAFSAIVPPGSVSIAIGTIV
ncbi:hypothetical protein Q5689_13605 [Microcoleus sp. ARI1-A2]|uniref:hypothetical protein n=1 Tax=unclassified Microcoleus TaxID=2642155 RepID=UPI002FD04B67